MICMNKEIKEKIERLLADFDNEFEINKENLFKILKDNENTPFGRRFDFSSINTVDEYRHRVHLTDYSDYKENGNVFSYKHKYTLISSGTTGVPKRVYLSEESLKRYSSYVFLMPFYISDTDIKNVLHVSVFGSTEKATILSAAYYAYLKENGLIDCNDFVGGEDCLFSSKKVNVPYVKLRCSLACEDLSSICSTFLYDVLMMMNYLENNWKKILDEMEKGIVSENLPDKMKNAILNIPVDKKRIEYLKKEFSQGFDNPVIPRIWKKLKFISGVGGRLFDAYDKALKRYTGDIDVYYFSYAQSECLSALATKMNDSGYTIMPRSAFFEFLSIDDGEVYLPSEVEKGKKYQLIITTFSGMYRYKTGDIVEITGKTGQSPEFEICDRAEHLLNIDGEKVDEITVGMAIDKLIDECKIQLSTYFVGIDKKTMPSRYALILNANNFLASEDILAQKFDDILKSLCIDYLDLRELKLINPPICRFVSKEAIESIQTGHTKPGIILPDNKTEKILNYEHK